MSGYTIGHVIKGDHLVRRAAGEFLATAMLVMAVVGSGILAERLAGGNVALALLANTIATGAALAVLILTFIPISGAHLNPVVTLVSLIDRSTDVRSAAAYILAQFAGALAGVGVANLMFGLPAYFASVKVRTGPDQFAGEFVATFGLIAIIRVCARVYGPGTVAAVVALYVVAAIWFSPSTCFTNPAVTLGRSLTDTFTGIRPIDVPAFVLVQSAGALFAYFVFRWLDPGGAREEDPQ